MAVRNYWVETVADGKKLPQETGPKGKNGGFRTRIFVRKEGDIHLALDINGWVTPEGKLKLTVEDDHGLPVIAQYDR